MKWVPCGDNLVKDVQCYELFGGIAPKNHTFSFSKRNPSPPKHWFLCVVDALELYNINLFSFGDV